MLLGQWVSPNDTIYDLETGCHVSDVYRHPERFGIDQARVKALHEAYGERLGTEGRARDAILIELLQQGWLRVNFVVRSATHVVTAWRETRRVNQWLEAFGPYTQAIYIGGIND